MAVAALKQKSALQMFHATVLVTRAEEWCVEAETAAEARELLAQGHGHRCHLGDRLRRSSATRRVRKDADNFSATLEIIHAKRAAFSITRRIALVALPNSRKSDTDTNRFTAALLKDGQLR